MRILAFVFAFLLPAFAAAGAYEDLEEALIRRDSAATIELIKRGVDVNSVDRAGNTLLIQAIRRDMPDLFEYLMQHRARINTRNQNGESALSIAAYVGKQEFAKRLVDAGAEVNFYGWSPLSYAAYNGHAAIAEYLLQHGAEINAKTENGSTALFFAARFGHAEVVKLLLKNGADVGVANENDETAVDWALKGGNTDIESVLRSAGGRSGKSVVIDMSK
jgi:hypothetical protein